MTKATVKMRYRVEWTERGKRQRYHGEHMRAAEEFAATIHAQGKAKRRHLDKGSVRILAYEPVMERWLEVNTEARETVAALGISWP